MTDTTLAPVTNVTPGSTTSESVVHRRLPPVTCEAWCEYQDGHAGHRFRKDQFCSSRTHEVERSLEDRQTIEDPNADPQVYTVSDCIEVYLMKTPDEPALSRRCTLAGGRSGTRSMRPSTSPGR